jgi:hypothetical protein
MVRPILCLMLLLAAPAHAAAQPQPRLSPPPPGWTSEHDDDDGYQPPAPLAGIYGHGFTNPQALAPGVGDRALCQGDEASQAAFAERAGDYATEFWFYATASQGVLFRRSFAWDVHRPCAGPPRYIYELYRAYIADGMIHSFVQADSGDASQAQTARFDTTADQYSGEFSPLHNLMARGPEPPRAHRRHQRILGLDAICWGGGDLVWSNICVSRSHGRSYGMILATAAGDDEREMFHLSFDALDPRARLDGRLFELDRRWLRPD